MGKIKFSIIRLPEDNFAWSYSAKELNKIIADACTAQKLKKVYTSLYGYLESLGHSANSYDFSYLGGTVIMVFDSVVICFRIHVSGMIEYLLLNPWEIKPRIQYDLPPEDRFENDCYFYDMGEEFELEYEDAAVENIVVNVTDAYPFKLKGFDTEAAASAEKQGDLPQGIEFVLDNGVTLGLCGDWMEYFFIRLMKQKNENK